MSVQHLNPPGLSTPAGYTHVVTATGGTMVFISGQIALNDKGELVGAGDLAAQARQVYRNLGAALAAVNANFENVVKQTTYVVNYQPEHRNVIASARAEFLPAERPPASTLVGVQALARPDFLIEIEAVAVVP